MIESLSPKKRPLKGRKSLHVGAAKGILGKRPVELDEDDENGDDDEGGTKRLKNFEGSPVKNVKLRAPPSKEETTGRVTRATRRSLELTSGNASTPKTTSSPAKAATSTTPKGQARFVNADALDGADAAIPFESHSMPNDHNTVDENSSDDRIQLQDFLNLTSIRFMELTTTKRRHTVAPGGLGKDGSEDQNGKDDGSLENCVVSAACTLPMLELFQHVSFLSDPIPMFILTHYSLVVS
jgi:kinetochore protein Spc7/SPC105